MDVTTLSPSSKTGGLLTSALSTGAIDEIQWTEVTLGDLIITVASDALKAALGDRTGVRLPVSYRETVAICRELGCVAPTKAMADAMFAQAKEQLNFVPLVRTAADSAKMTTVEFVLRFHDGVEKQLAAAAAAPGSLAVGAWKYWILHPRLVERGAVNYGFWDKSKKPPAPIQTVGGQHDASHYDYSQLLQPVKRMARRADTGEEVDLLTYIAATDKVPERFLAVFNADVPLAFDVPVSFDDDVVAPEVTSLPDLLTAAGVEVEPLDGWEQKGRAGFHPEGIMVHHTAGPKTGDAASLQVCIHGRPDLAGPLCHIFLSRSGTAHVLAANITNHAGKGAQEVLDLVRRGEAVTGDARGNKYADSVFGNEFFYGIEVENSGTSADPYPPEQIEALTSICAALCTARGWTANRVIHHRQWTQRKIDMSFRGDLLGLIAQKMDAGVVSFGMDQDPTEPTWEPDPDARPSVLAAARAVLKMGAEPREPVRYQTYLELLAPAEPSEARREMAAIPSSGLVVAAIWRAAGVESVRLDPPYVVGTSVSRLVDAAVDEAAWVDFAEGQIPGQGDVVILRATKEHAAHAYVVTAIAGDEDGIKIDSIEGGPHGHAAVLECRRTWKGRHDHARDGAKHGRVIEGWIDVTLLRFAAAVAVPPGPVSFDVGTAERLPSDATPVTSGEMIEALGAAWQTLFSNAPKHESLLVLVAQWALETGWGKYMHAYNIGNVKSVAGDGADYTYFTCDEYIHGKHVYFYPDSPGCRFRAYPTLELGAADYLQIVSKRYAASWTAVIAGDPAQYAHLLKAQKYYTGSEADYASSLVSIVERLGRAAKPAEGTSGEPNLRTTLGVQQALQKLGQNVGTPDGIDGPNTRAAVKAFQASVGLTVDGLVGPATRSALADALAKLGAPAEDGA